MVQVCAMTINDFTSGEEKRGRRRKDKVNTKATKKHEGKNSG